jgi:hypothetical protein
MVNQRLIIFYNFTSINIQYSIYISLICAAV